MMQNHLSKLINQTNAVKVAQFILNLDQAAIREPYEISSKESFCWLNDSLTHYLQPFLDKSTLGLTLSEKLEHHVTTLIRAIRSTLPCLTDEAQAQLHQFLLTAEAT